MHRVIFIVLAVGTAALAAAVLGSIAHVGLGIPRDTIRTHALASVIIVGIAVAGAVLVGRKRNK